MFAKLGALLKIRRAVEYAQTHPEEIMNAKLKPGITTTEFWTLVLSQLISTLMAATKMLDGELAVLISTALTAAYTYIRSGFKLRLGLKLRDGVLTSEFWATLASGGFSLVLAALDKVDGQWAALSAIAVNAVYVIARKSIKGMEIATPPTGR
jgi:hypothetical protein